MVHNLPENFNIYDFDVFHSALMSTYITSTHTQNAQMRSLVKELITNYKLTSIQRVHRNSSMLAKSFMFSSVFSVFLHFCHCFTTKTLDRFGFLSLNSPIPLPDPLVSLCSLVSLCFN